MAAAQQQEDDSNQETQQCLLPSSSEHFQTLISKYLGLSFTLFLGSLPRDALSLLPTLQTHNQDLNFKLLQAQEDLKQLYSRRKEDSKANARVVEIFATHRHAWQQEEKRLLQRIDESDEEIEHLRTKIGNLENLEAELRASVEEFKRGVSERDEMLNFMSQRCCQMGNSPDLGVYCSGDAGGEGGGGHYADLGLKYGKSWIPESVDLQGMDEYIMGNGVQNMEELSNLYGQSNGYTPEFLSSASKFWSERSSLWQDVQYESRYNTKHFVARRESPWKVDGQSTGVSPKLKLLEQELLNLETVGKTDLSNLPSLMRKQAKRYQALSGKIDDLCRRMQTSDPCEPTLASEFRTQRQSDFYLEACRLQQRASETGQKLVALQAETGKSCFGDKLEGQGQLATRRSLDSIRNNFGEIQRNLEIWLARIIGDLEGNLARDGVSRMRDYYKPRNHFVQ